MLARQQSIGGRIKLARNILGLSRKDLEDRFQLSVNTLQSWESDRNVLTDKGARKLNDLFNKLGLLCSEKWLLTGEGQLPVLLPDLSINSLAVDEEINMLREMEAFKTINQDSTVVFVNDDGMEPFYSTGDFVGGKKREGKDIDAIIGEHCIVETFQGDTLVRKLLKSNKANLYNLACTNIGTIQQILIPDLKIRYAARVIIHRRK